GKRRARGPDQHKWEGDGPGQRQKGADIRGDAFAASEAEPHRKEMTDESPGRGGQRKLVGEITVLASVIPIDKQDGEGAFERIADQRRRGQAFAAGAQHVGGADIAGAEGANVLRAGEPRQDQPEGDGTAEVAGQGRRRTSRQQRRIEPWRHGGSLPFVPRNAGTQGHGPGVYPRKSGGRKERRFMPIGTSSNGGTRSNRIYLTR